MSAREVTLRLEAFDRPAQRLIAAAQALADARGSREVEPLHVLYRALEHSPLAARAVSALLADGDDLIVEAEALVRALPKRAAGAAFLSAASLALLQRAEALAGSGLAGVAHLLGALASEDGPVGRALEACSIHPQALRVAVSLSAQLTPPPEPFSPEPARRGGGAGGAPRFTRALGPALHPIVGRDAELARMLQVLARSEAHHPLLVGEHGVGRRSLVRALAERLAGGAAPAVLSGKRVVELDLAQLAAGARLRGELEERTAQLVASLHDGAAILYVSELDALLGARFEPVLDALSTALARDALRLIAVAEPGALAHPEAAGLLRHMVRIEIEPPDAARAVPMLRASAARLEAAHAVAIDDAAIHAAAQLARRYVPSAQLPKSALAILDEAAAMQRIRAPEGALAIREAHVAEAVAVATGIPVARVQESEADKLLTLEAHLGARVIGQDAAVRALADAVRRGRVGLRDPKRPIGSFLFLGGSGVGKTELAKALAELLFDDEHALTRLDMSELMEKHTVSRLLGSPPGYADSEQGGFLTEAVRRRPYSVVLFDEIEKAHPDVYNVLLQVLDDGRLTDSRGRVAHFADTVVILTSNIGARRLTEGAGSGDRALERGAREAAMRELRAALRPELLNRIDEIVIFEPLGEPELARILELQLGALARMLAQRGVTLAVSDAAKRALVAASYDPAFGARPLRRTLQQKLQDPLAQLLLERGADAALAVAVELGPDGGLVLTPR